METSPTQPTAPTPTSEPVSPVTENPQPPTPATMATGGKKKWLVVGLVGAVVAALAIGFGVYAYATNTPSYLLDAAARQMSAEKVFAAKYKFVQGTEQTGVSFSGDIAARSDETNTKNGEVVIGLGENDSRVTLTLRAIDNALYLRAGGLDNLGRLLTIFIPENAETFKSDAFTQAFKSIDNVWYVLSKEDLASLGGSASDSLTNSVNADDIKKVAEIYRRNQFLQPDKTYGDETVDGVKSAHFSVKLDQDRLVAFMQEVKAANLASIKITDEDIEEAKKQTDEFKDVTFEVWIARDSKKFKQLRLVAGPQNETQGSITVTLVTDLPQLDKLEKPEGAKPSSEFFRSILGPYAPSPVDDSVYEFNGDLYQYDQ